MPGFSLPGVGATALARVADTVPPGSFAFVMATGIVSIAAGLLGLQPVAVVLFAVNLAAFPTLWALLLLRLWRQPSSIAGDLHDHRHGPGLLTSVAATCVFGSQLALFTDQRDIAIGLWLAGGALWIVLLYALLALMTTRVSKPDFALGVDGSWLLIVVATEALAVLGTAVAGTVPAPPAALFVSFCLFLLGGLFYLILLTLIVYRWLFLPMTPQQLAESYWINMGAAAIATLAGSRLLPVIAGDPALAHASGFLFTATVLLWSVATWWIPLLAVMSLWRYRTMRLGYRLENWSIVFPLGMYTAATWRFWHALGLEFLDVLPRISVWIALAAWALTFAGMARRLAGLWRPSVDRSSLPP